MDEESGELQSMGLQKSWTQLSDKITMNNNKCIAKQTKTISDKFLKLMKLKEKSFCRCFE